MGESGMEEDDTNIIRPRYLEEFTISRGRPLPLKSLVVTSLSSSADNLRRFLSAPCVHCSVCRCVPFIYLHGIIMSHRGHRVWGGFPSSSITTVSLTCRCQKCTLISVCVDAWPLHPSNG